MSEENQNIFHIEPSLDGLHLPEVWLDMSERDQEWLEFYRGPGTKNNPHPLYRVRITEYQPVAVEVIATETTNELEEYLR